MHLSKKSWNPGGNHHLGIETLLWRDQRKARFVQADSTKCNAFMQMKDCWLTYQGLFGSNIETWKTNMARRYTSCVHIVLLMGMVA